VSGTGSPSVRVLLVDDYSVVRTGVRTVLSSVDGVEVVGEAATADEALAQGTKLSPDIIFMDISIPGIGGIELTRRVCRTYPEVKVIILTFHEGDEYLLQAMQAGASGYVVKGASAGELIAAIEAVRRGGVYLDPMQTRRLVSQHLVQQREVAFAMLSAREREVVELLIEGLSNQEIASRLGIGVTTVQTHRSHIMEKLHVGSFGELIRYAIRSGAIEP
jgi:two-component system, NarL family, response regulator NreC